MRALFVSSVLVLGLGLSACLGSLPGESAEPSEPSDSPGNPPNLNINSASLASDPLLTHATPCDVRSFGAKGDGKTKDTHAIQAAINSCAGSGRSVVLSHGVFLSGTIALKSGTVFSIEPTATLRGTQDDADYPDTNPPTHNTQLKNCRKSLIYAESAHDVRIEGGGTIDGNGNIGKWLGPSTVHPEATRPMAIYTALCTNVTVQNVKIKDAAMWGLVNLEAENLTIRDVQIDSPLSGNRDGIDVVDCHHVTIERVAVSSEDDAICLKSGSRRGVEDVTVRNSHVLRSIVANALKLGTASYGSFRNITFEDIVIDHADKAAMAVESVDGADISNITFRRIQFQDVGSPIFVLLGDRGTTPVGEVHKVGSIDGVLFENIVGNNLRYHWSSPISGSKVADGTVYRLRNLAFRGVHVTNKGGRKPVPADPPEYHGQYPDPNLWGDLPAYGYFIRHADGVTFSHSTTDVAPGDARHWLEARDVSGLTVE